MSEKVEKSRLYLGPTATSVDAGRPVIDPLAVVTIDNPLHSMHDRYDPKRYMLENLSFAAIVNTIASRGAALHGPMIRVVGLLRPEQPEYKYLEYLARLAPDERAAIGIKGAFSLRASEPKVETIFGNSRIRALRIVNERRRQLGLSYLRQPVVYKALTDSEAAEIHADENLIRQPNSLWNNVQIVRQHRNAELPWEGLVIKFGIPAAEIARLYSVLINCERPLVDAYEAQVITFGVLKRLSRYARPAQADRLNDWVNKTGDFAPKPRGPRQSKPVVRLDMSDEDRRGLLTFLESRAGDLGGYADLVNRIKMTLRGE